MSCSRTQHTLANSEDQDEMPQNVAFHLGLHCLSKYSLTGSQFEKINRKENGSQVLHSTN